MRAHPAILMSVYVIAENWKETVEAMLRHAVKQDEVAAIELELEQVSVTVMVFTLLLTPLQFDAEKPEGLENADYDEEIHPA